MANNGGRQGGGAGGNQNMNEHVEFTVKAGEDLYLTGSENTILRVSAETNYSCLMLKTQRFSSLFRHYAKYHGLRKDDLEYYFVNALENEDTPESVQLQRGDTIMVRKRRRAEPAEAASDDEEFVKDMRELLDDEEHMDAVFLVCSDNSAEGKDSSGGMVTGSKGSGKAVSFCRTVSANSGGGGVRDAKKMGSSAGIKLAGRKRDASGVVTGGNFKTPENTTNQIDHVKEEPNDDMDMKDNASTNDSVIEVRAHKAILTARAEYFKAHFRTYATQEGKTSFCDNVGIINVDPCFTEKTIRLMLEFIYTNRIKSTPTVTTNDLMCLLHLSDVWILRDLKRLVEHELIRSHMDVNTVARMYCATEDYRAERLGKACIDYIMENIHLVTGSVAFQEEMKHYPGLCIPILQAAAELIPEQPNHKKQRTGGSGSGGGDHGGTPGAAALSSPVPDTDS